jgi:NADPH-dependent 2,4-dienoyl-CoA reductase/sulfur reductase-like enzyme
MAAALFIRSARAAVSVAPARTLFQTAAVAASAQQPKATATTDAIVIGAGIIGSSIALQLARKGLRVTVLDKNPYVGSGSTAYSSGIWCGCVGV